MRRLTAVVVPLVLLAACAAGNGAATPERPTSRTTTPTTTTTTATTPADHANLLSTLLGPVSPSCPQGTPRTNTTCGELMSGSKKLVDLAAAALKSMPTAGPYAGVHDAVTSFNDAYSTLASTGCYTSNPVGGVDDGFCHTLAILVSLSWLNLHSTIDQLR